MLDPIYQGLVKPIASIQ